MPVDFSTEVRSETGFLTGDPVSALKMPEQVRESVVYAGLLDKSRNSHLLCAGVTLEDALFNRTAIGVES